MSDQPSSQLDRGVYWESLTLIERLHRQFLDLLKSDLEKLGYSDINNVQSLILYNIGDDNLTVGDLTHRGYYLGSNVSYNLKKLVENGYLDQERSRHDRRSSKVQLTEKGADLRGKLAELFDTQVEQLDESSRLDGDELTEMIRMLKAMERFWGDMTRFVR
jgi:DNA-binding MarR family transcriptional regulator